MAAKKSKASKKTAKQDRAAEAREVQTPAPEQVAEEAAVGQEQTPALAGEQSTEEVQTPAPEQSTEQVPDLAPADQPEDGQPAAVQAGGRAGQGEEAPQAGQGQERRQEGEEAQRPGRGGQGARPGGRAAEQPGADRGDGGQGLLEQPGGQDAACHPVRRHSA